ncbi:DUF4365 domain-containing protein [Kribbella sp. CA-253562]|uniref:DUF4365 domain-containing protein n=1 Tax=Kribbella sp. CA-253562 TaxID=3239942 RepID=UPI003D8F7246
MTKVPRNRRAEREAINATISLFERNYHIVQPVAGENDFGEDLFIRLVDNRELTGHTIAIQVKGGTTYRASGGYRVRVGSHRVSWSKPNVPVICIVHDPDSGKLHWSNATEQLGAAPRGGSAPASIFVPLSSRLDDETIADFVTQVRSFLARSTSIHRGLAAMADVAFESSDYVGYFMNVHGERLIFQQKMGSDCATLFHSDLDWEPVPLWHDLVDSSLRAENLGVSTLEELDALSGVPGALGALERSGITTVREFFDRLPIMGGVILDQDERSWLRTCFAASTWWRQAPPLAEA